MYMKEDVQKEKKHTRQNCVNSEGSWQSSACAQFCFKESLLYKVSISSLLLYWGFKYNLLVYIILYLDIFQKVVFALLSAVKLLNRSGGGKARTHT